MLKQTTPAQSSLSPHTFLHFTLTRIPSSNPRISANPALPQSSTLSPAPPKNPPPFHLPPSPTCVTGLCFSPSASSLNCFCSSSPAVPLSLNRCTTLRTHIIAASRQIDVTSAPLYPYIPPSPRLYLRLPRQNLQIHVPREKNPAGIDLKQLQALRHVGQRDVDPLFEASAQRVVQIPREIRGRQNGHNPAGGRLGGREPVHLDEKLGLDAERGVGVGGGASFAAQSVDFVDEHGAGRVEPGHFEQKPDQFLGIAAPFAGERGRGHAEEGGAALRGDGLPLTPLSMVQRTFARSVLPVPGGPKRRIPFQGRRMPWKTSGITCGSTTASSRIERASLHDRPGERGKREAGDCVPGHVGTVFHHLGFHHADEVEIDGTAVLRHESGWKGGNGETWILWRRRKQKQKRSQSRRDASHRGWMTR